MSNTEAQLLPRHSGLDPESTFFSAEAEGRWAPDQVRGDAGWTRALACYRRAEFAVTALEGSPDEEAFGDAVVALNRALERLLLAPAPDAASLAAKLALARRHLAWELPAGEEAMAAIERDARTLAGLPGAVAK
jgi:hypothetical protein